MERGPMTIKTSDGAPGAPIVRLVDGDPVLLREVELLLRTSGFRVERYDTTSAFLAGHDGRPGCIVLDVDTPEAGGLHVQRAVAAGDNPLPVIFLTARGDVQTSVRAMKSGAVDFLTKPVAANDLIDAIRRAIALDAASRAERRARNDLRTRYQSLTTREREVFIRVARGLLNKQIAWDLGTSERTIKAHRANVMRKMALGSVADLARAAGRLLNLDKP
jgi:FixJ family two-component response regulator